MKILVNGTELNAENAYAERDTAISLYIQIPYTEMDYAELKALFKGNAGDIVKITDDGSTELFSGFSYESIADDEGNDVYIVKMAANEHDFQMGRNRQLEAVKAGLESKLASSEMEISTLNASVSEKNARISEQEIAISEQKETIESQSLVITELEQEIASKDEEIAILAEQCADLLYASAIEEINFAEKESEEA